MARKAKVSTCTACGATKPKREFSTRADTKEKRRQCRECRSAQRRQNYLGDRRSSRHYSWRQQGIDPLEAEAWLAKHDGHCELCGRDTPRGMGDWHIDHVPGGKVRGVLCFPCNIMLGKVERLGAKKVLKYLRRSSGPAGKSSNPPLIIKKEQ